MARNNLGRDEIPQIHVHIIIWYLSHEPEPRLCSCFKSFYQLAYLGMIELTRPYHRTQSFWKGVTTAFAEKSFCFPLSFASRNVCFTSWELPGLAPSFGPGFLLSSFYAFSCSSVSEFCSPLSCCCFALNHSEGAGKTSAVLCCQSTQ